MEGSEDIIITIFLVSSLIVLMLLLLIVGFVITYQRRIAREAAKAQAMELAYQKALLRATLDSQERERKRIAKDLHDGVGAMLSTLRLFVGKMEVVPPRPSTEDLKVESFSLIDATIATVRQISRDLLPPDLEQFGLGASLGKLAEQVSHAGGMVMHCTVAPSLPRLPVAMELGLFRIVQELCNNSLKHAQAGHISLQLDWNSQGLQLVYADDGKGIPRELLERRNAEGLGLRNIESRAHLLGATTAWDADRTQGMELTLSLPAAGISLAAASMTPTSASAGSTIVLPSMS